LALFGGTRAVMFRDGDAQRVAWPVVTDAERAAVAGVLDSGAFTSVGAGQAMVRDLEKEWARFTGTAHCVAVSSGTSALELSLAAARIEPGAEVLVPALSFVASAVAPVHRLLIPVFVDIDPVTYTIDPVAAAAAVTPRTRAILAVHLHGLPCDMAALRDLADRHGLLLVEDAAQAHGARYRDRRAGGLADIAAFSLNSAKNLPTCGEGGLVTTDDPDLAARLLRYRQFGEDLSAGGSRDYLSHVLAGNAKLSAVQAAFTRCQLDRLAGYEAARNTMVRELLTGLAPLPGLVLPHCPPDRTHAWHMLRLRFDPIALGHPDLVPGALRALLHRVLRAEGVPIHQYQPVPLPAQPAFAGRDGLGGYPWRLPGVPEPRYRAEDYPIALDVIEDSLTLQRWHLNPAAEPLLRRCVDAFEKVWENLDTIAALARARSYRPAWQRFGEAR
jgi:perosamine synthetase